MRILHVGKYYPPFHGGMERVVSELCEGLAARGHHVRAAVASVSGLPSREWLGGVEVVRLQTSGLWYSQPLISGLARTISEFKPDLVHFHLPNPLSLLLAGRLSAATVLTIHADAGGFKRSMNRILSRGAVERAQALIFSSNQLAAAWSADRSKSHVIPFGFRFHYLRESSVDRESDMILFVGRLVAYKGIDVLLRAMTRVRAELVIVGGGAAEGNLRGLARELNIDSRVRFVGEVSDGQLSGWYQRCAVYVQASVNEGEAFGISMLEAMHMGCPVISTDLPTGVRSVNLHLQTGLVVPPRDPLALAAALNSLIGDPTLRRRLGAGARAHVRSFQFARMIDAHLEVYRNLMPPAYEDLRI